MLINNLQFWVSSVLSLLININQETILDFLNIDGPFNTEDYSNLFKASQISTPVSIETFALVLCLSGCVLPESNLNHTKEKVFREDEFRERIAPFEFYKEKSIFVIAICHRSFDLNNFTEEEIINLRCSYSIILKPDY